MQGWQDLPTQILIGVIVNAILGILCWLMKREFLFFKRMTRVPRSHPFEMFPKRKNNYLLQRPFNSKLSLAAGSNTSPTIHLIKKISFFRQPYMYVRNFTYIAE